MLARSIYTPLLSIRTGNMYEFGREWFADMWPLRERSIADMTLKPVVGSVIGYTDFSFCRKVIGG